MKKKIRLYSLNAFHSKAKWFIVCFSAAIIALIHPAGKSFSQSISEISNLRQKALLFKNKVEYDSAVFYYTRSNSLISQIDDKKSLIQNRIDLADIYILQLDFQQAQLFLIKASEELRSQLAGESTLKAELYQVKGSYLMATGIKDSAKYYLEKSIEIRTARNGDKDTALHYAFNKLGNLYIFQSDFDSAYFFHKTALDISLLKQNKVNYLTASSYQNLGIAAHLIGDFNQAETFYTKSLQLKEQLFDQNDPALAKIYWNLGKFFTDLSKYNLALFYYDKSEQLLISKYDREDVQFAHVYWNKGNVYTHQGNYIKATSYLSKAYSILEKNQGADNQTALKVLTDLGFAYNKKGDTLLAINYYHQAAKNKDDAGIIKIYRNLGNIYQSSLKADSADKYYNLAIEYSKKFFSGNSYDLALCYQYYGEFMTTKDDEQKAKWYFSQASEIFQNLFGRKNKDLAQVFILEGGYYLEKKEFNTALNKIQAALVALIPAFESLDLKVNPSVEEIVSDLYIPNALNLKARAYYERFSETKDLEDLSFSLATIHLTLAAIEEIRKSYNDEESQMILNNEARKLVNYGVLVTNRLYNETGDNKYIAEAFKFSEKGQSIILLSALRGLQAQSAIGIPKIGQDFENNLSSELATYNSLLYQEKQKKVPDEAKIQLWSDKLFNLRLSHDSLMDSYEKRYPEFFRLKYDYSIISCDSILKWLPDDQAIIEYHLTDSTIFGFLLTNQQISIDSCGPRAILKQKLDSLLKQFTIHDYFNAGQKEFETIVTISADLYDILIKPFEGAIAGKRLIIIADGELGYLSFDLLLNRKLLIHSDAYSDLPWLIKSNSISYSSSSSIYFEQSKPKSGKTSSRLLAFAPSYDFQSKQRSAGEIDSVMLSLSPLTGTKEEIYSISGQFKTNKKFNTEATEDYFKKHAGKYGILHLAMHTIIDNQNPLYSRLVFSPPEAGSDEDGYLNTYELFRLSLPGQLAVLSACNTGGGKLERGEGIISLARGFFYAGIPSVLMTLWEIEDHSSANLMALFYENLRKGYPNDVALQLAKLDYIEKAGKLQSHPYFWAGYVSIGKTSPIELASPWKLFYFVISGAILLIFLILIYFFINNRVFFHKKRH